MPKRNTADANVEPAVSESKKRSATSKPKATAAATHKRTPRIAKAEVATTAALPVETVVENSVPASPVAEAAAPTATITPRIPTREEIAALAYAYWEERGYQSGSPNEDWFRAEQELLKLA